MLLNISLPPLRAQRAGNAMVRLLEWLPALSYGGGSRKQGENRGKPAGVVVTFWKVLINCRHLRWHMYIEARGKGKRRKSYLARSYRQGRKVRKDRVYLGTCLGKEELALKREVARKQLEGRERLAGQWEIAFGRVETSTRKARVGKKEWEKFVADFTYNSNAVEGSSITRREACEILKDNLWPDKPKEDIAETYGIARAARMLSETKVHLSLPLMLELHKAAFRNSKPFAGKIRRVDVVVKNRQGEIVHRGAPWSQVKGLLLGLVEWYNYNRERLHPLVLAAVVHCQCENIHPFRDGTGRVGKLLMNNILLKNGRTGRLCS